MIIFTGNSIEPNEFRKLKKCLNCGKRVSKLENKKCEACKDIEIKHCNICDIILRENPYSFYTYDVKDFERETRLKPQKNPIKEFFETRESKTFNKKDGDRCEYCFNTFLGIKDTCFVCKSGFYNDEEWYKEHGNLCLYCDKIFPDIKAKSYLRRQQKGGSLKSYPQYKSLQ